ncbi:tetratricopeptide repeat protein [Sorangium sp. So ce406]|uniref:tetratricopeptide repeat protein n=1 Tax=Sorangium sp. So ce406 TaxID=3133311 RepID=UPI003F5B5B70
MPPIKHLEPEGFIEDPTDADYAVAARWALQNKDFRLALQQASAAVAVRPLHEPHLRLLDQVIAKARAPLELLALPAEGAFFGLVAARARALARLQRLDQAVHTLFQAVAFSPDTPFAPWALSWVATTRQARRVAPATAASAVLALVESLRGRPLSEGARSNLDAALVIAERIQAAHGASEGLLVAQSRVLRALGRGEDAAARLAAAGESPGWEVAVEWASLHEERGDLDARARWLERACDLRRTEPATWLDLGEAYLTSGRVDEAVRAHERALELEPASRWAAITAAYARSLLPGALACDDLAAHAQSPPELALARSLDADLSAWTTRLGDPIDPIAGVLRSAAAQAARSSAALRLRVRADRPLAPSAHAAFRLILSLGGGKGALVVEHEGGAPRRGPLWTADAGEPLPAVPRPPDAVLGCVRALSSVPFRWDAWCARAAALCTTLDPCEAARLLDAMAHPPEPPSRDADPVLWVHGFQVAAALLAAHGAAPRDERMARLGSLLAGVDDWSAGAALLGLRALAGAHPELRPEIVARAAALVPAPDAPLPPCSRALAVLGCELATAELRRDFLRLRARIRAELADRPALSPACAAP